MKIPIFHERKVAVNAWRFSREREKDHCLYRSEIVIRSSYRTRLYREKERLDKVAPDKVIILWNI